MPDSQRSTQYPLGSSVSSGQLSEDPYSIFHALRAREPITWAGQMSQWLITSRDLAMEVLRDAERFRTDSVRSPIRDTFGPQMLSSEGADQRRYKTACAAPFNARAVDVDGLPTVKAVVAEHLGSLRAGDSFDARRDYAAPIAVSTVARVMGLPLAVEAQLRDWYDAFAAALENYEGDAAVRLRAHAAAAAFRAAIGPLLANPNATERTLIAELARAHPRLLDDYEIGSNALIVLFGGIETTEASIANALWAICTHPSARARAERSDDELDACIEESLRWEPAVQTCTRYVSESMTLHGADLEGGDVVQCMIGAMNRDPAHYPDPDRYDPWRAPGPPHIAFGFGRHFCLGAALARAEIRLALRGLFDAVPGLTLDQERSGPPRGHEFRKPRSLVVQHPS